MLKFLFVMSLIQKSNVFVIFIILILHKCLIFGFPFVKSVKIYCAYDFSVLHSMQVIQQENQILRLSSSQHQIFCNIIILECVILESTLQECLIFGLVLLQVQKPCKILIHGVGFFGLHLQFF